MTSTPHRTFPAWGIKGLLLLLIAGLGGWLYHSYGNALTLENLASRESELRNFQEDHPVTIYGIAFAIYVVVTGLSLPGAAVLTLLFGWYFGFLRALLLVSFASTTGATVAFLMSRYLLRDLIQQRFGDRLMAFNDALQREGAYYLFTLRLIPAVPFFIINLVMGVTPMRTSTYWWVSQLGMLPGTAAFVYAGSQLPNLQTLAEQGTSGILTPGLILAFVLLALVPLILKRLFAAPSTQSQSE